MTADPIRVPKKLKHDAILEAIFEIRFDMPNTSIPEIFLGRIADHEPWRAFSQRRLPASQLPALLRHVDENLRYQAVIELVSNNKDRAVRVGPQVLSYHRLIPYVGWERFKPELDETIEGLFMKAPGLDIHRLGLRYTNALRPQLHGVSALGDLNMSISIAGIPVLGNMNIGVTTEAGNDTQCAVRIATPEFIQGDLPRDTVVVVDVDVSTKERFRTKNESVVKEWTEFAHTTEKQQFFRLLKPETINSLTES